MIAKKSRLNDREVRWCLAAPQARAHDAAALRMNVVASVAVSIGSSRLPGKAMRAVRGNLLLGRLLDRLDMCRRLDGIVVAAPNTGSNDVIEDYCAARVVPCYCGAEDDVLGRKLAARASISCPVDSRRTAVLAGTGEGAVGHLFVEIAERRPNCN